MERCESANDPTRASATAVRRFCRRSDTYATTAVSTSGTSEYAKAVTSGSPCLSAEPLETPEFDHVFPACGRFDARQPVASGEKEIATGDGGGQPAHEPAK